MDNVVQAYQPYINKDGFVAGTLCNGQGRVCDNHLMFTAEAYLILKDNAKKLPTDQLEEITEYTKQINEFQSRVQACTFPSGWFTRYPGDPSYDQSPDNLEGYLVMATPEQADKLLEHETLFDGNVEIYTPTWADWGEAFTWRFPHIVYVSMERKASIWRYFNPLYWLAKMYAFLYILTAGITDSKLTDMDNRRLAYLVIRALPDKGIMKLASNVWFNRLRKQIGDGGMRTVYLNYFLNPNHPSTKYAINPWD